MLDLNRLLGRNFRRSAAVTFAAIISAVPWFGPLLLVPPLYMLQVFDRVLASRSGETLAVLTIAALTALVVMALLEVLRARLLAAAGAALDQRLGPRVLDGLLAQTARLSGNANATLLGGSCGANCAGNGLGVVA